MAADDARPAGGELPGLAARATGPILISASSRHSADSSRLFRSDNANGLAEEPAATAAITGPYLLSPKTVAAEASSWQTVVQQSSPWLNNRESRLVTSTWNNFGF